MKKITTLVILLVIILAAVILKNSFSITVNSKGVNSLETKENTEGPIAIAVTPLNLRENSPTWDFEVSLNTHSGSIEADLTAVSELLDDKGKLSKPVSWEGDNPGGHHRQGVLKFNTISPKPKSLELKIKNIGGISERSFQWNL